MSTPARTHEDTHADIIENLNNLISTCKTGEAGFRTATDDMKDLRLKKQFIRLARQQTEFAAELRLCVQNLGNAPPRPPPPPLFRQPVSTPQSARA